MSTNSNYLALDVGEKRIGVALASSIALLPAPLVTLLNTSSAISDISRIVANERVGTIVVGLPLNRNSHPTQQTEFTMKFIDELKAHTSIPTETCDEAQSSMRAKRELAERKTPHHKEAVDALAATYILEDYLREKGVLKI